ncbi:MAG: type II toxin-antitoxin system RelB/DinJ family antitoxin [Lachnospiraceae bacterium]|jgi:DNA-damage-inducible protein J|nr:type II toxin-antitoxin system RelB/DinJ family antitoxin [Lachnospiraceae bacterium]MBR3508797.1 type II toxin-antitoxin system RelB/DinJ family antitoxin [Lachnospiraceae bacterium]MBR4608387.1 type II toxin-antitoxin system RelB/DinJ family antitoxin [Lachnospiraceae bacterium]
MALTTLTSRVEEQDKAAFDDFCSSVGLTASAAINMYVKVVVRDRKIPFEIKQEDPFYSATNQAHLMKAIQQLKEGKGTVHELIEDYDE